MNVADIFQCHFFQCLSESERQIFLDKTCYSVKKYSKGEFIAMQGDDVNNLYVLLSGKVKTEMFSESANILYVETISAITPLAPAFLFSENNHFPVDVTALENCEVILIPKTVIMKLLSENQAFLQSFLTFNSNKTQFLSDRLKQIPIKTLKGKIAAYILQRADNKDRRFELGITQTQLAEYFGVARPSIARSLAEMIADNIISLNNGKGEILDINSMRALIS